MRLPGQEFKIAAAWLQRHLRGSSLHGFEEPVCLLLPASREERRHEDRALQARDLKVWSPPQERNCEYSHHIVRVSHHLRPLPPARSILGLAWGLSPCGTLAGCALSRSTLAIHLQALLYFKQGGLVTGLSLHFFSFIDRYVQLQGMIFIDARL